MARFVSRYTHYSHGVREEVSEQFSRGTRIIQKPLEAVFDPQGLTEHEKEVAIEALPFPGLPEDGDTERDVSPVSRLSLFDSEQAQIERKWSDEEHDLVVKTLRESTSYGYDYIEVNAPKWPAPWNGYDNLTDASTIADLAIATETDIKSVLGYELENLAREDVITELEALLEPQEEDAVVIDASA